MSVFTPGPWTLETVKTQVGVCHKIGVFPSRGVHKETYGCVYEDGAHNWRLLDTGNFDSELLANARLMAAAPELLTACRALYDILLSGMQRDYDEMTAALGVARKAIAKAEGKA